ncbi:MAG: energy-coupling factor transporter transmembrane protein EcfT [Clostridiaceae bacterium]|nr:energy-coupling factor transporter transmembrane protein EcfT [Clostridiaceae bacterium]
MIRDITIGQYYAAQSLIHRLDPRLKIIATMVYIISLFTFHDMAGYVVAILSFGAVVALSKVPLRFMLKGLKPIFFILVFTACLNLFATPGKNIFAIGVLSVTWEGLWKAVYISLRLIFLILGSSVMTLTTTPDQLTNGLEKLLGPLKAVKVPVHELAMMMSIALRFIPILVDETNKIMKAQAARGADFESGNLLQRLKNLLPILVPLFASSVRRAGDLALAMDARCYHGGGGRTKMYPLNYQKRDLCGYLVCIAYIIVLAAVVQVSPF